jgi:hypothetical protein
MIPSLSWLEQLGSLLHWEAENVIATLWAQVDDSNIHDRKTGRATIVGHGGGIATCDGWKQLEREWKGVMGETVFHMTDFEHYRGDFENLTDTEHKRLLNALLAIIKNHMIAFVGCSIRDDGGVAFVGTHKDSIKRMLHFCHEEARQRGEQKINLIFAKHEEVSEQRIAKYLADVAIAYPYVESFAAGSPRKSQALQAADLLAYEFVRWRSYPTPFRARYPVQFLYSGARQTFHIFHTPIEAASGAHWGF